MKILKYKIILLFLGVLVFSLRLFNINEALYDDEANFAYSLTVMDTYGFNHDFPSPQPFNLLLKPFISLFGLEVWVFRFLPFLFGIINSVFVYLFARRHFGEKAAFFATALMFVGFYPTLASLQLDVEGNVIMFSFLLMIYAYLEYENAEARGKHRRAFSWQIVSGIGLGIAVISKYNSVYVVVVLILYALLRRKWLLTKVFSDLFLPFLVGLALFLTQSLLAIATAGGNWLSVVPILSWVVGFGAKYQASPVSFLSLFMYLFWATPLLLGFYFLGLKDLLLNWEVALRKMSQERTILLLVLWITGALLFYTSVITYGSFDRYLMNTIPALALLGGCLIDKFALRKRHLIFGSILLGISVIFLYLINLIPIKYIARLPAQYLAELKQFNLFFLFSYTSASGPTFGVSFATIFFSFFFALFFLFLALFSRKKKKELSKLSFTSFLAISLAFNLFLMGEYTMHPTGIDVSAVKQEMIKYTFYHNLDHPIYTTDSGMMWYFNHHHWLESKNPRGDVLGIPDYEMEEANDNIKVTLQSIRQRGGTALLLNWPPLPENSRAWEIVRQCRAEREFFSHGQLVGAIYTCDPLKKNAY